MNRVHLEGDPQYLFFQLIDYWGEALTGQQRRTLKGMAEHSPTAALQALTGLCRLAELQISRHPDYDEVYIVDGLAISLYEVAYKSHRHLITYTVIAASSEEAIRYVEERVSIVNPPKCRVLCVTPIRKGIYY